MPIRLHRASPQDPVTPAAPRLCVVPAPGDAATPRLGTPKQAFPPPPTVRLAPPMPLHTPRRWDRWGAAGVAALGAVALVWGALAGARVVATYRATLEGVVVDSTRGLVAPATGKLHLVALAGARVEAGATIAELLLPAPVLPVPTPSPEARRLEEGLRHAESALALARKHQSDVDALWKEERATKSEHDDAARDVRFRQNERDRLATALAAATATPPAGNGPAPLAILADAPVTVSAFRRSEGADVESGETIASLSPRATSVEAPLGKTRAPDEGAPVTVRLNGSDFPGRIAGIHVDGGTRTVTVAFDAPSPVAPGARIAVRIGAN